MPSGLAPDEIWEDKLQIHTFVHVNCLQTLHDNIDLGLGVICLFVATKRYILK